MFRLLPLICGIASLFVVYSSPSMSDDVPAGLLQAPPGYEEFCAKDRTVCAKEPTITLDYSDNLLQLVNSVNKIINVYPHEYDAQRFLKSDYWQSIDMSGGDSEDYAIKKKQRLLQAGIPAGALRFKYVLVTLNGVLENHVVLAVKTNKGDLILDNSYSLVKFQNEFKDYDWILEETSYKGFWKRL